MVFQFQPPPSTKRRRKLSLLPSLSALCRHRPSWAYNGPRSLNAHCFVLFSLACRRGQPFGCARGSASALFTISDGPAIPLRRISFRPGRAAVEPPPLARHRRPWTTDSITWIVLHRRYQSSRLADIAPALDSFALGHSVRRSHPPCLYSTDSARHPCSHQCYTLTRGALARHTFERQNSPNFFRDTHVAKNRVRRISRAILAHRLGA